MFVSLTTMLINHIWASIIEICVEKWRTQSLKKIEIQMSRHEKRYRSEEMSPQRKVYGSYYSKNCPVLSTIWQGVTGPAKTRNGSKIKEMQFGCTACCQKTVFLIALYAKYYKVSRMSTLDERCIQWNLYEDFEFN